MKITPKLRETRTCAARVDTVSVRRALRKSGRCGAAALDFGDVRVAGELVALPLCRAHFRMLRDSPDPLELAGAWAPDASPPAGLSVAPSRRS
jgi:hypothetical protein